jgi:hypothetical protein
MSKKKPVDKRKLKNISVLNEDWARFVIDSPRWACYALGKSIIWFRDVQDYGEPLET